MSELSFLSVTGRTLVLVESVVATLERYRQVSSTAHEAGGLLLGRHLLRGDGQQHLESKTKVVDEVTEPMPADARSRFSFRRSKRHQDVLTERWLTTHKTMTYLGGWHSHPEAVPQPSDIDRKDWIRAVRHDQFEGSELFFVIVGTKHFKCWRLDRSTTELEELWLKENC